MTYHNFSYTKNSYFLEDSSHHLHIISGDDCEQLQKELANSLVPTPMLMFAASIQTESIYNLLSFDVPEKALGITFKSAKQFVESDFYKFPIQEIAEKTPIATIVVLINEHYEVQPRLPMSAGFNVHEYYCSKNPLDSPQKVADIKAEKTEGKSTESDVRTHLEGVHDAIDKLNTRINDFCKDRFLTLSHKTQMQGFRGELAFLASELEEQYERLSDLPF